MTRHVRRVRVTFGERGVELLDTARGLESCLIAVGRNGGDQADEQFFARATEFILAEGDGPVLVVSDES
jgi:hypothetical protein